MERVRLRQVVAVGLVSGFLLTLIGAAPPAKAAERTSPEAH